MLFLNDVFFMKPGNIAFSQLGFLLSGRSRKHGANSRGFCLWYPRYVLLTIEVINDTRDGIEGIGGQIQVPHVIAIKMSHTFSFYCRDFHKMASHFKLF